MKKLLFLLLLATALYYLPAKITVQQTGDYSYRINWELPGWKISTDKDFSYVITEGLGFPDTPGKPSLPFDECKTIIPQNGTVFVSITAQKSENIALDKRIRPVPEIYANGDTNDYSYQVNEQFYAAPEQQILLPLANERFRKLSFVPIRINPFLYDGKNNLKVITSLEFTVTVQGNTRQNNPEQIDELTALVAKQTVNPGMASVWQTGGRSEINYANFSLSDYWVRVDTDKDGMFKITPSQLSMLPVNDIDPATFRMFTTGGEVQSATVTNNGPVFREVPIYVSGESDGVFNSGDYVLFYGRDRDGFDMNQNVASNQYINPYSNTVSFWLTFGGSFTGTPQRIILSSSSTTWDYAFDTSPATVRIEEETYQRRPVGFDWYTGKLFGSSTAEYSYSLTLEDVDPARPQTLNLMLVEEYLKFSDKQHNLKLKVNGNQLTYLDNSSNMQDTWNWIGLNPLTVSNTNNFFVSGTNTLLLNVLRTRADNLYFDYYQVLYQKRLIKRNSQYMVSMVDTLYNRNIKYAFTGNNTGVRVFKVSASSGNISVSELPAITSAGGFSFVGNGTSTTKYWITQDTDYYAPATFQLIEPINLTSESQVIDNLIITVPEFQQQAQTLASFYNEKYNKRSKVVMLQDIFNQFNAGMPDPNAIRLFLKHCVTDYPAPGITSVTLLGTGTIDWRNFSGQSAVKNKIIVYQKSLSSSDDFFGMLSTSSFPEIVIGRYPVRNQNELAIMLSNLDRYVSEQQGGIWRNSLVFVADDQYNGLSMYEYEHSEQLQSTTEMINPSILIDKIFAIDYEFDEFQNKPQVRDDMMSAINSGKLVWYYIGHGSFDTLGAEDYFKGALDMGRFDNAGKMPLFIAASCDIAQFDSFAFDCLAEKVVLLDNKGAIASIAATRECYGEANVSLLKQYYRFSLNQRNPIGYSLLNAKFTYTNVSNNEKYNILGDPLLLITTPERDSTITVQSVSKDPILNSREQISIAGQFSGPDLTGSASLSVYDTEVTKLLPNNSPYTFRGKSLFRGSSTVTGSRYNSGFVVPDDVTTGNSGLILSYLWDAGQKKDYVNYLPSVQFSDQAAPVENTDDPQIHLYLDDTDFIDGDIVGSNPLLIAVVSDSNGINLTNAPGHSMLLILDYTVSTTNVTDYFAYDTDSYTQGTLNYQITGLEDGNHVLQLIAFDNFNRPSVASINFEVKKSRSFTVEDFLPYPNPMQKSGWFTFSVSEAADVKISIYTVRGRKIKTITASAARGYNQIAWDGRDADGDYLANNTYFIRINAKALSGDGKVEKTEKLVIYH
jgi:hypothetical protein